MKCSKLAMLMAAGLVLGACHHDVPLGPGFGNAVHHNNALQIVDPNPPMATNVELEMEGKRAGLAIGRYETGDVIVPSSPATTN